MKIKSTRAAVFTALIIATGSFGLTACSTDAGAGSSQTQTADVDVKTDLEGARQAVEDALAEQPNVAQVMLAGDVTQPTEKYGLLVMPFVKSEAADRVTGTVNISDGNYVIEATSAETDETWQIDQDGNISAVAE
ncbi:hypothetical protein [Microbacterium sp. WCS2018Hpa-23]|uniref:hypothetical protein n=1 Tax=Microbacterium sp. WCS2018Hpa-23 TaxID=3073634 RepID=UPI002882F3F5|nr:hypothetical protein [Microbacterium sp. WCS2018Hpa-23]